MSCFPQRGIRPACVKLSSFFQRCQFHDQDAIAHCRIWLRYSSKRTGVLKPSEDGVGLGELTSDLDVEVPAEEDVDEGMSSEDDVAE
jgi:hypothetical protein